MKVLLQILIFLAYLIGTAALAVVVLMFCALFLLYRARGWPEEPEVSNCWGFAVPRFLHSPADSYLVVSKSRYTVVPHVSFAPSIEDFYVEEFKPLEPKRGWSGILDALWFRGRVRKGKGEEK